MPGRLRHGRLGDERRCGRSPVVKVEDGAFYVNGSKKGIPYSGDALHLSPHPTAGTLCVEYHDGEGALGVFVKEWE